MSSNTKAETHDLYTWAWTRNAIVYGDKGSGKTTLAIMMAADWAFHGKDTYFFTKDDPRKVRGKMVQSFSYLRSPRSGDIRVYSFSDTRTLDEHVQRLSRKFPDPDLVIFDGESIWGGIYRELGVPTIHTLAPVLLTHLVKEQGTLPKYLQHESSAIIKVNGSRGMLEKHRTYQRGGSISLHKWASEQPK